MKLAIVVRRDLGMRTGKIAVQVGHASVLAYRNGGQAACDWVAGGQKKVVLKVDNEAILHEVADNARFCEFPVCEVRDFGLTQVEPNTLTCIGIGPAWGDEIDKVVGELKLL